MDDERNKQTGGLNNGAERDNARGTPDLPDLQEPADLGGNRDN
jgi:hypothetical protein